MTITIDPEDIRSIDIKYREKDDTTDGYAVVHLQQHIPDVSVFHFTFSMNNNEFLKQVSTLEAAAQSSGYQLNLSRKSGFALGLEKMLVGVLAGTEYQSRGCPSCRMIDTFVSSHRYQM